MTSDLPQRLTQAFIDLFAANVFRDWEDYEGGGRGYYGVQIENVGPDGSAVDLILTFLSGKRYCCFEFADHFAHYSERGWSRLRECMDLCGLEDQPVPLIRSVRVVIEKGAVMAPSPKVSMTIWEGSEYQTGPFFPTEQP